MNRGKVDSRSNDEKQLRKPKCNFKLKHEYQNLSLRVRLQAQTQQVVVVVVVRGVVQESQCRHLNHLHLCDQRHDRAGASKHRADIDRYYCFSLPKILRILSIVVAVVAQCSVELDFGVPGITSKTNLWVLFIIPCTHVI